MTAAGGHAAPGAYSVRHAHEPSRLAELREEWRALFDLAGAPSPFLSWEWIHTWWRRFGRRRRPWILEARDPAGRLAGVLALSARQGLMGVRRWQLLGASSDHLVLDAGTAQPVVGSEVRFGLRYDALLRAMTSPFVSRTLLGGT